MTKTTTATAAYQDLLGHAEQIKNDEGHDLRSVMEAGDAWAQGDLLIRRLDRVPDRADRTSAVAQLAPGQTQGSRHCLSSLSGVTMYLLTDATPLEGPVFETTGEVTIEHPEHGDVTLSPGVYAIEYQRAYAEELRRVAD